MPKHTPRLAPKQLPDGTISISLGHDKTTVVDSDDGDLSRLRWRAREDGNTHYAEGVTHPILGAKYCSIHRVILERMLGRFLLPSERCDHIDGNGLNNRRENLRLATLGQNQQNRRRNKNSTSKYKGVSWHVRVKKWQARIGIDCCRVHLGYFDTPEAAYAAYCEAAKRYHGDFARLD